MWFILRHLNQFLRDNVHWAVILTAILAVLTFYNVKPPSSGCTKPTQEEEIAQEEAEQQYRL